MACKTRIFVWILLSFLLLPRAAHAQDQRGLKVSEPGIWGNYQALIIGINAYKEWSRLQTAVNDAISLKQILINRYNFNEKNVILRLDDSADRLGLLRDLRDLASNLREYDNLLIYYAGHGQIDDLTGDGYWIPVEGKLKDPGTWISHSMLKNILSSERVKGKNIVVIADSCYSGNLLRGGPGLLSISDQSYRKKLVSMSSLRSRQVITSGGLEPVADGGRDGHSLFAYYFLKALKENPNDIIDIENLIHSQVWKHVAEIGGQRPSIGRLKSPMDEDGQFVLVSSTTQVSQTGIKEKKTVIVSQGKIRSTDEQFEILFWESIKDSNNLKMYEDYVRKFPSGTFVELARINIQNLSKAEASQIQISEIQKKKELEAQKKKDLQASISSKPAKLAPPVSSRVKVDKKDSRFKLGVFPWKLTGTASRWNFLALGSLTDVIAQRKNQIASLYTYYEIKTKPRPQVLDEDYFTQNVVRALWSGSGDQPNVSYVRKIGKQLGVDAVFICNNYARPWDPDPGTYKVFMVDVHSGKMYQGVARTQDIEGKGEEVFEKLAQRVFDQYIQYRSHQTMVGPGDVDTEKKDVQASLTPVVSKTKVQKPDDSQIKLAVFPWKLTGAASRWNFIALGSLKDVFEQRKNQIAPLYTYYEIKIRPRPQVLDEDYFTQNVVRALWSGSGDQPNVSYVRKIGKQLGVDAVFICNNYAKPWDPDPGTYKVFMVDVHSGKMYQGVARTQDIEGRGEEIFEKLAQRVIGEYMRNQ